MTQAERDTFKEKIQELVEKHVKEIGDLEKAAAPVSPENSIGRISRMDAINNKSVLDAAIRNKKQKLSKLKIALSKIDKPDFGICLNCKKNIQPARLLFMPESSKCVYCAGK